MFRLLVTIIAISLYILVAFVSTIGALYTPGFKFDSRMQSLFLLVCGTLPVTWMIVRSSLNKSFKLLAGALTLAVIHLLIFFKMADYFDTRNYKFHRLPRSDDGRMIVPLPFESKPDSLESIQLEF